MSGHYLKLAYRNCLKQRLFTFISVVGLAVGLAASTLFFIYIHHEESYDRFYPDAGDLYRVNYQLEKDGNQLVNSCLTQPALSWELQHEPGMIAASCRTFYEDCYMYTEKVKLYGQQILWADSAFLEVFQPKMIMGSPQTALAQKYAVVISETVAHKYFGDEDPVGQIIKLNEGIPFAVTGVFKDLPENTHLHYDFVVSFRTLEDYGVDQRGGWGSHFVSTYFRKNPSTIEASLNELLAGLVQKYLVPECKDGETASYSIQPVHSIYLDSSQEGEFQQQGNRMKVSLLFVAAIFILSIAWANNISISTALSFEKTRESGILKLHGASNRSLITYHLAESFLVNLIAVILSFMLVALFFPLFRSLVGVELPLKSILQPWLVGLYLLFLVGGVLVTGGISAWIQSLVHPLQVLKNVFHDKLKFNVVRRALAVAQFALAIVLVISTILIIKQIDYLRTRDLGMKADQVLVMRAPATNNTSGERRYHEFCAFREDLLQLAGVESVTATMNIPGQPNKYNNIAVTRNGKKVNASFNISFADENYFPTYQVPLVVGRNFYPNIAAEQNVVILNEKAVTVLGFNTPQEAIGEKIMVNRRMMQVVGVARDFHNESLRKAIEPYIYQFRHPHEFGYYPALVSSRNVSGLLKNVEKVWRKHYSDAQADFFFLDSFFNRQYQTYTELSRLVGISALLAIFIACMGLFAFAMNTINKKTKEIGIRKANGARVGEVVAMLNRDLVKWVAIAFVIAIPIAWYAMHRWLENFAYKTELSWWIFALAGLLALGIALLTVSFQSYKAATRNPVEALRYE